MDEIRFHLNGDSTNQLTLGDMVMLDEINAADGMKPGMLGKMRDLMARFMVDEKQEPLSFDEAVELLNALPVTDIEDVATAFSKAIQGFADSGVSPTTAVG